ncbi:uncharacterized protein LOC128238284 isoform X2 [Mya arenaria]|uniref:uncharacterized protein LOC128238284 isoform X2 n=1 Tax=Mya arenaria TaxID=6604 RepID=UPI0022E80FC5|nr:uncharacterized protein LOC128238284 isoform X2 [Mya arenaria]
MFVRQGLVVWFLYASSVIGLNTSCCDFYHLKRQNGELWTCGNCLPGYHFVDDCEFNGGNAKCSPCPYGYFMETRNVFRACRKCKRNCPYNTIISFHCTSTSDLKCGCMYDKYLDKDVCVTKTKCQPGYGVNGTTSEGNTKCVKCPEGTFSRNNSYEEKCVPDTDDCKSMPCVNNGTCTDLVDDFSCTCLEGFSGRRCEHGTNNCMPMPCVNNGACTDLVDGFICTCLEGFSGQRCEHDNVPVIGNLVLGVLLVLAIAFIGFLAWHYRTTIWTRDKKQQAYSFVLSQLGRIAKQSLHGDDNLDSNGPSPEISDEMQKLIADGKKKFDDDISQLAQDVKERLSKDKSLDVKEDDVSKIRSILQEMFPQTGRSPVKDSSVFVLSQLGRIVKQRLYGDNKLDGNGPSPEKSDEMQKLIADEKKKFDDDISQLAQDVKERLSKDKSLDVKEDDVSKIRSILQEMFPQTGRSPVKDSSVFVLSQLGRIVKQRLYGDNKLDGNGPSPEKSDEMQKLIADEKKKFDDDISQLAQDVKERLSKDKSLDVKEDDVSKIRSILQEMFPQTGRSPVKDLSVFVLSQLGRIVKQRLYGDKKLDGNVLPPGKSDEEQGLIPDEFEYHDGISQLAHAVYKRLIGNKIVDDKEDDVSKIIPILQEVFPTTGRLPVKATNQSDSHEEVTDDKNQSNEPVDANGQATSSHSSLHPSDSVKMDKNEPNPEEGHISNPGKTDIDLRYGATEQQKAEI